MKKIPDLGFWKLWNISFGFFGVQIAYALQSANIRRIFSTLGADPHSLSYFWILPPLAGIIVQPIIGALSVNPEKPDVPLNKNDAFQKVQKRRVQEKR